VFINRVATHILSLRRVKQDWAFLSLLCLSLCTPMAVYGQNTARTTNSQDAAERAILSEIEYQQALQILRAAPTNGGALQDMRALQQARMLMDQLEYKLNSRAVARNFRASEQDELSEYIRERMELQTGMSAPLVMGGMDTTLLKKILGVAPLNSTRWDDIKVASKEAGGFLSGCGTRTRGWNLAGCKMDDVHLAAAHENAWAKCFQEHDWVKDSSRRTAFEACMKESDPMFQACGYSNLSGAYSCPDFFVHYYDVENLRNYRDRWEGELRRVRELNDRIAKANADPNHLEVAGEVAAGEPLHVTLLEPVVVPASTEAETTIPVQLENPIVALIGRVGGTGNFGIWQPARTKMEMHAKLTTAPGNNGGLLQLSIVGAGEPLNYQLNGLPSAGTVIFPAEASLSFATKQSQSTQTMSTAEFQERIAARKSYEESYRAAGIPPYVTRPILAGSEIQAILQEPVDVKGVLARKDFHAKLMINMMLPRFTNGNRNDAIVLPRGTDLYLKVTDQQSNISNYHYALLSVDYVVWNGQKVPVRSSEQRTDFQVAPRSVRAPNAGDRVLWPSGANQLFRIVNQVEVPTGNAAGPSLAAASGPPSGAAPNITPANNERETSMTPVIPPAEQNARAPEPTQTLAGVYVGRFRCGLESFDLRLTVIEADTGALTAIFDYSPLVPPMQQRFIFDLAGKEEISSHRFQLAPVRWESSHPPQYQMVGMKGTWDPRTRELDGRFSNVFCGGFHLLSSGPPPNTPASTRSRPAKQ